MSNKLSIILITGLLALAGYLFLSFFEPYEEIEDLGWSKAALRNPLLAAQLFVRQINSDQAVDVKSLSNFEMLEDLQAVDMIFISNSSQVLSEKRLAALLDWLRAGGHLIVAAQSPQHSDNDRLLTYFSITTEPTDFKANPVAGLFDAQISADPVAPVADDTVTKTAPINEPSSTSPEQDDADTKTKKMSELLREYNERVRQGIEEPQQAIVDASIVPQERLTSLSFDGGFSDISVEFNPRRGLHHPFFDWDKEAPFEGWQPFYWQGDDYGVHFLQIYVTDGLLTVMSDGAIWQSQNIGKADHAFLLQVLAANSEKVRFFYGAQMPSIFQLMRRWLPELIFALAVWLLAWLLYRGQRFGPIRQQQITTRRSMQEHIFASAAHHWRQRQMQSLLKPLRDDIARHARRSLPNYDNQDVRDQYSQLSSKSNLSESQVEYAMNNTTAKTEDKFLAQIQSLQMIRKSL
jgi:hypothetical protein